MFGIYRERGKLWWGDLPHRPPAGTTGSRSRLPHSRPPTGANDQETSMNLDKSTFDNNPGDSETLNTAPPDRLLTTSAAAIYLGLPRDKLANLRHSGGGPDWVQLGRTIRYIPGDLNWWLEQTK